MTYTEMQRADRSKTSQPQNNRKMRRVKINLDDVINLVQKEVDCNPGIIHISKDREQNSNHK